MSRWTKFRDTATAPAAKVAAVAATPLRLAQAVAKAPVNHARQHARHAVGVTKRVVAAQAHGVRVIGNHSPGFVTQPIRSINENRKRVGSVASSNLKAAVHNPYLRSTVKAVAIGAAVVYTGGLAAAAMGGGMVATAAGTAVASGAATKLQGRPFSLKAAVADGVMGGLGQAGTTGKNIKNGVQAVQAAKGLREAKRNHDQAKAEGEQIAANNRELKSLNAEIEAENSRRAVAAQAAQNQPADAGETGAQNPAMPAYALSHEQKQTHGAVGVAAGGLAALKILALLA